MIAREKHSMPVPGMETTKKKGFYNIGTRILPSFPSPISSLKTNKISLLLKEQHVVYIFIVYRGHHRKGITIYNAV
jgi:hypothetical protein